MRRSSLRWTIPLFLALQLGLLWMQGAQLHRQNLVLQGLREDIQALTETIEEGQAPNGFDEEAMAVPASLALDPSAREKLAVLGVQEEQDPAQKEIQESRESAQKAVKEAREARSKLSIEENIKKAEEAKKVQAATRSWQTWVGWALALVVVALIVRSVLRRRG